MTTSLVMISAVLIALMTMVVGVGGFEPPTSTLSVLRSNQLSYTPELRPLESFEFMNGTL